MTTQVIVDDDGIFCIFRGETERRAVGTEHLKEELEALHVDSFYMPQTKRTYGLLQL